MAQQFRIHRVTALPTQLEAYAVYLVASATNTNYVEMYVSNSTGSAARRIINEADIEALINSKLSNINEMIIVDNITARDSVDTSKISYVYVKDAQNTEIKEPAFTSNPMPSVKVMKLN